MLSDELKQYIESKVANVDVIDSTNMERYYKSLDNFFELARDKNSDLENNLIEMMDLSEMRIRSRCKDLLNVEAFMKVVFRVIKPELYAERIQDKKWTLIKLYREEFNVVPEPYASNNNFSVGKASEPEHWEAYKHAGVFYYYLQQYFCRNANAHRIEKFNSDELFQMVKSYLVVMLHLCDEYALELEEKLQQRDRLQKFSVQEYCENIILNYQRLENSGFGYTNIRWYDPYDEDQDGTGVEELLTLAGTNQIKLSGEAGSGKSTALKRMEYLLAQKRRNGNGGMIPVYVELYSILNERNALMHKLANILEVQEKDVDGFLCNEEFCLLLDGFNEILDGDAKRNFARELDRFVIQYPAVRVFLTDRNLQDAQDCLVLDHAKGMKLSAMTLADKSEFFRKNCHDAQGLQVILKGIQEDPEYFEDLNTPLKLKELITVASLEGKLPFDIIGSYIRCVIKRERIEKKDANMKHMEDILAGFAGLLDKIQQEEIQKSEELGEDADEMRGENMLLPRIKAYRQMTLCTQKLGYTETKVDECMELAINMGLLIYVGNRIGFASKKYFDYFLDMAIMEDIVSILEE